jgi:hypothetical protein
MPALAEAGVKIVGWKDLAGPIGSRAPPFREQPPQW